jgi:hypothetical protein
MKDVDARMSCPQMQRYLAPLVITRDDHNGNSLLSEINKGCKRSFDDDRGNSTAKENISPMNDQIDGFTFRLR